MKRHRWIHHILAAAIALTVVIGAGQAEEPSDPVATQLEHARQKYKKEYEQFEKSVGDLFEKKEETVRRTGSKQALDVLRADRKSFEDDQIVPSFAPPSYAKKQTTIRADLERAYNVAIKDYIKKRADDEAAQIESELKDFRNAPKVTAIRRTLLGTWSLRVVSGYTADLVFQDDGTVKHTLIGSTNTYRIDLDAGFVYLGPGKETDRMKLPLNDDRATGFNGAGQETTFTKKK